MNKEYFKSIIIILLCHFLASCYAQTHTFPKVKVGAESIDQYLSLTKNKNIALLVNHTSMIGDMHVIDTLLSLEVKIKRIFAPEHGFRGNRANGEKINDGVDQRTGLPIISLYGKNKKATKAQLDGIEVVIFDIQDVGARFYTYISSMHYMMEACAENNIDFMVLDRPNPNADYIDGPVLETEFKSFVGKHPIPIVHAMTIGELALMIKGEGWINKSEELKLSIIRLDNWNHQASYEPPVAPSPNLPNLQAIRLYPSLCLFEGTNISMGRGTPFPFQVIGYPDKIYGKFEFSPKSIEGISKYPKHQDKKCYGSDLRTSTSPSKLNLSYIIDFYDKSNIKDSFFNPFFTKLAGTKQLQSQIEAGLSESEIRQSWQANIDTFKSTRKKYLLYQD